CSQLVNVSSDDLAGSYAVTQHLVKLGHKRIAFFTSPPAAPWSQERSEGYRRALREAGMDVDDKLVFEAGHEIEDGAKAALQMIGENSFPNGVGAVYVIVCVGCVCAILKQIYIIPESTTD